MIHPPDAVHIDDLAFRPSRSFVYYCAECEAFADVAQIDLHTGGPGAVKGGPAHYRTSLHRVEVVDP